MEKKRMLISGISLSLAGSEKALLSFLNTVDYTAWDVTLLLAKREGELINDLPESVKVLGPMLFGEMFFLSKNTAHRILPRFLLRHPTAFFLFLRHLPFLALGRKRAYAFARLWVDLMRRFCPAFEEEFPQEEPFDLVLSFFGDRTMFYACDKVDCPRHLTWLHFEYTHPPREDRLYRAYFAKCDRVISVTEDCSALLRARFPELSSRFITFENRISPARIRNLAARDISLAIAAPDRPLILTVARICEQKGVDRIPVALKMLKDRGLDVNWCILGMGTEKDRNRLLSKATEYGVDDRLFLLGTTENPYPLFASCDVFVLPSRYEGKPITVEEAKILGCAIVVCDYLASRKQLENGTLGIICPQDDGSGIALAIAALLESPTLRDNYKNACLASVPDLPGQGAIETDRLLSGQL